jgi:hypothetical protein
MWAGIEKAVWSDPNVFWSDGYARWAYSTAGFFNLTAVLYYFEDGLNKTITYTWQAPAGSIDWNTVNFSMGVSGQKYFHLTVFWYFEYYDVEVFLDHLLISDQLGDKYRENWQYKAGKVWEYDNLYRKSGWLFTPGYRVPYFEVLYLDP